MTGSMQAQGSFLFIKTKKKKKLLIYIKDPKSKNKPTARIRHKD